jgi:hypothetical protein
LQSGSLVLVAAAGVGRIDERRSCRIDFADEDVVRAARGLEQARLESPRGDRKIRRIGIAGNDRIARGIDRDRGAKIDQAAAEITRIRKQRIDHERQLAVIRADRESDRPRIAHHVSAGHRSLRAVRDLVNHRRLLHQTAIRGFDDESAVGIDRQLAGAIDAQPDAIRIRAGRDREIVLEAAFGSAIDHLDAGIDIVNLDSGESRDVGAPSRAIASDEVVALAR